VLLSHGLFAIRVSAGRFVVPCRLVAVTTVHTAFVLLLPLLLLLLLPWLQDPRAPKPAAAPAGPALSVRVMQLLVR
jgi:hypothetical protein